LPVIALVGKFFQEYTQLVARWAAWAEAEVDTWTGTTLADGARVPDQACAPTPTTTRPSRATPADRTE
jgi:hypothetical protein